MKQFRFRVFVTTLVLFAGGGLRIAIGQGDVDGLLARFAGERFDYSALYALEAHPPDSRIIPALVSAFHGREAKTDKQEIAAALLRLGGGTDEHFDFLADYARKAVEDRTPSFMKYDGNGRPTVGQFSGEFENWCVQNSKDPRLIAALQVGVYPEDVLALAKAQDQRATTLFRKGLDSPYPMVVALSVQGLGRLQDVAAIPLIAAIANRFPESRRTIAMQLPWYSWPEAEVLRVRLMPDRKVRDFDSINVEQMRALERKRVLSRTGGLGQK